MRALLCSEKFYITASNRILLGLSSSSIVPYYCIRLYSASKRICNLSLNTNGGVGIVDPLVAPGSVSVNQPLGRLNLYTNFFRLSLLNFTRLSTQLIPSSFSWILVSWVIAICIIFSKKDVICARTIKNHFYSQIHRVGSDKLIYRKPG